MLSWQEVLNLNLQTYASVEGSQLRGFLLDQIKRQGPQYLFDGARELIVVDNHLKSNLGHSLSLLVYAALHPQVISLGSTFQSQLLTSPELANFDPNPETFFKGNNVSLPRNKALDSTFKSFEHWTGVNEVKHVSMWLIAALRGVFGVHLPSALEVEIPLPGEPRPGRLDVVAKLENQILCFEAKTSISDAIKDRRFVEQVPKYKKEIITTASGVGIATDQPLIFLVTGGAEDDLRCRNGVLSPSPVGMKLLEICQRHDIKFVTANAIWQMLATSLVRKDVAVDLLFSLSQLNSRGDYLGLTSAGFITKARSVEQGVFS